MITIFDYGAGNLRSVENTLAELGCTYTLVRDGAGLRRADKILLPGVGHFGQMMRALDALDVRAELAERIRAEPSAMPAIRTAVTWLHAPPASGRRSNVPGWAQPP